MILAVNIGNTNVRAAIGQTEPLSDAVYWAYEASGSGEFIDLAERSFGADLWDRLEGSIVSSVVPDQTSGIMEAIKSKTGKAPRRVDVKNCGGVDLRHYGGSIGEDRVVCCVGALKKYKPPFVLIDFGTATTINVVSKDREFLGGAILAGVQIGLNALTEHTAQLPRTKVRANIPVIGKNTAENLISGAVVGAAFAAEGYIRHIARELGLAMPVIVTGGHATMILPHCDFENIYEHNLLLDGLFALYK